MILKECPMCGCDNMFEIPEIGCKCTNCEEIFRYDDRQGVDIVSFEEWIGYINSEQYERK